MRNVLVDPPADAAEPMTIPGKVTCRGLIDSQGFGLTIVPVTLTPCCVEYPVTPF
jgi:hypothetical protein